MNQPTMRAAILEAYGQPLRVAEVPRPVAGPGQVLVRIAASGVSPLDTKIHAGEAPHARQPLPAILGVELAGTVEAIAEGVTRFKPGDEVYGLTGGVGGHPGSLAEYTTAFEDLLALKPKSLSLREAAVLPLNVITAWEGLVDRAGIQAGQTLLVQGGAGGVGNLVLQIARAKGAVLYATGSTGQRARIEALGAAFIDRAESAADSSARLGVTHGFDVIYNTIGGAALDAAFASVRRFGHVVSSLGWGTHSLAPLSLRAATYSGVFTLLPLLSGEGRAHHGEILAEATRLAEAGQLSPQVDPRSFSLDTADAAHRAFAEGGVRGKLVVDIATR